MKYNSHKNMDFDVEYERYVPKSFPKDLIQQAVNYKPMANDVFIVSYPKCGTTWTQQILYLLLNDGVPPNKTLLFSKSIPFLELCAPEAPRDRDRHLIRGFKTHLPSHLAPYDKSAKYIYCVRNPMTVWYRFGITRETSLYSRAMTSMGSSNCS